MENASPQPSEVLRVSRWESLLFSVPTLLLLWLLFSGGFTWESAGHRVFSARRLSHPALGLVGIAVLRWLISPAWRASVVRWAAVQRDVLRRYHAGGERAPWLLAMVIVGAPVLFVYLLNDRLPTGGDAVAIRQTAASLVLTHDCNIDEYVDPADPPYQAVRCGDHWYSGFPPAAGFVFLAPVIQIGVWINPWFDNATVVRQEKLTASIVAAAACVAMFLALARVVPGGPAWWLAMLLGLGTGLWTTGSHLISQHGPVCLLVAIVLWLALWRPDRVWTMALCGLCCGLAAVVRPTAAIFGACIGVWLLASRPRTFPLFVLAVVVSVAPFLAYHEAVYGHWLGAYRITADAGQWRGLLQETIPANLVSPARGLLIWTPLAALAFCAATRNGRRGISGGLAAAVGVWIVIHLVTVSKYTHWWGGHSYGPRFLIDVMPGVVLLMAPTFARAWQRGRATRCVLLLLIGWSVFTQYEGAFGGAFDWVRDPVNVDVAPARNWDFADPPFLYDFLRTGPPPRETPTSPP